MPDFVDLIPEQEATIREAVGRFGCSFTTDDSGGLCGPHYSEWYVDWSCCYRAILEAILVARADADRLAEALREVNKCHGCLDNWESDGPRAALAAHDKERS